MSEQNDEVPHSYYVRVIDGHLGRAYGSSPQQAARVRLAEYMRESSTFFSDAPVRVAVWEDGFLPDIPGQLGKQSGPVGAPRLFDVDLRFEELTPVGVVPEPSARDIDLARDLRDLCASAVDGDEDSAALRELDPADLLERVHHHRQIRAEKLAAAKE